MIKQLLLCKRLMIEGVSYSKRNDAVSSGIAISLFQDSVEMFIWALIKNKGLSVKESSSFISNIEILQKYGICILNVGRIFELNKARVNFKHYGNLPDVDEANKFRVYVEDFLRTSFKEHFDQDFDEISLIDLVKFSNVRDKLKDAVSLLSADEFNKSAVAISVAKVMLFAHLNQYIPQVDQRLKDADSYFKRSIDVRSPDVFNYIVEYFEIIRENLLATFVQLPLQDYTFIRTQLPPVAKFQDGTWRSTVRMLKQYDESTCRKAINCLVNISIRLESLV